MWCLADPLDAAVGLVDHLGQGRATEVGELDGLAAGHRPSSGFNSGAWAGRRSTTGQNRWPYWPPTHGGAAVGRQASSNPQAPPPDTQDPLLLVAVGGLSGRFTT